MGVSTRQRGSCKSSSEIVGVLEDSIARVRPFDQPMLGIVLEHHGSRVSEPVVQLGATCGTDAATYALDRPGSSAFVLQDGVVYHTYSTYSRGVDGLWGKYQWLDRAHKGRNETGLWVRRHDKYDKL